jgi:hypothetical protein
MQFWWSVVFGFSTVVFLCGSARTERAHVVVVNAVELFARQKIEKSKKKSALRIQWATGQ